MNEKLKSRVTLSDFFLVFTLLLNLKRRFNTKKEFSHQFRTVLLSHHFLSESERDRYITLRTTSFIFDTAHP